MFSLCRPPNTGQRQNIARLLIGLVIHINIMADESVEVEQTHGNIGAVRLVSGFSGETSGGDIKSAVVRA